MSARLIALACALALVAPVSPASAAADARGPYDHVWQAEGMFSGERGETRRLAGTDEMSLRLEGGSFIGHVAYADVLGTRGPDGAASAQSASIEITLAGTPADGGGAAAGSFSGQATLVSHALASLDELRGVPASSDGSSVVYEVSGHWGARLSGGIADGELLYERATPLWQESPTAERKGAEWFNRLSAEPGGAAQRFRVEVSGLDAAGKAQTVAGGAGRARGFFGYVARGLAGQPGVPAAPVPLALAKSARALKDAAPPGAAKLPADSVAVDVDVPGAYLDAKNRAAGLLATTGPTGDAGKRLTLAWAPARAAAVPLPDPATAAQDLVRQLRDQDVAGSADLARDVEAALRSGAADPALLQAWQAIATAVRQAVAGSVLGATQAEVDAVRSVVVPRTGPYAAAVLVSLGSRAVPPPAFDVRGMAPDRSLDSSGSAPTGFPGIVLARAGGTTSGGPGTLTYTTAAGRTTIAPDVWLAYERADGTIFWLAGSEGAVALQDGTLRGAGFTLPRAYLDDASYVGRILAVFDLR